MVISTKNNLKIMLHLTKTETSLAWPWNICLCAWSKLDHMLQSYSKNNFGTFTSLTLPAIFQPQICGNFCTLYLWPFKFYKRQRGLKRKISVFSWSKFDNFGPRTHTSQEPWNHRLAGTHPHLLHQKSTRQPAVAGGGGNNFQYSTKHATLTILQYLLFQ